MPCLPRYLFPGAAALLVAVSLHAAAPANDNFGSASVLTGSAASVIGNNSGAGKETGEPNHAGNLGGKSVWWTWTAPADGDLTIDTDGSEIDTLLAVYTGTSVTGLSGIAASDDHGVVVTSRVRFSVFQGTACRIAVDGYDGEAGGIVLNLNFLAAPLVRPANDAFASRPTTGALPLLVSASNVNATREPGEPEHAGRPGDTSVWWSWTAPFSESVRLTTEGSTIDTLLAVYRGIALTNLSQVATNDDADPAAGLLHSTLDLEVRAGERYEIAVDGYDGAMGAVTLRIEPVRPRFALPTLLPGGRLEVALFTLSGTTNEVLVSSDLGSWSFLGSFVATQGSIRLTNAEPGAGPWFYRARRAGSN